MRTPWPLLLGLLAAAPAAAQSDVPPEPVIVAMAQHLVQDHFMRNGGAPYHIEFDTADLHPQPEKNYWAVVGGYVSDQTEFNIYVAAVRLVCPAYNDVTCWSLDKLAVNDRIILNRKPL